MKKQDDDMRPYANMFLIFLVAALSPEDKARWQDAVLSLITV